MKRKLTKSITYCRVNIQDECEVCGCDSIVSEFFGKDQSEILNHGNHKYLQGMIFVIYIKFLNLKFNYYCS